MSTKKQTAGKTAKNTKTIKLPAQTLEKAAAQEGQTPAEYVACSYSILTGRKVKAQHVGTKNGVATFEVAASTAKSNGKWRETTRKGDRVIIDPAGRVYHGTPEEVRKAALMPDRRDNLAQSLHLARHLRREGTLDAESYRAMCESHRREAIWCGAADAKLPHSISIPADALIMLEAGMRFMGYTPDDFAEQLVQSQISVCLDLAECETGKREIPLTRHERAALDRICAERERIRAAEEAKERKAGRAVA